MPFGEKGYYQDTNEEYHSLICYINGIKCYAQEAYFGGIVMRPFHDNVTGGEIPKAYCKDVSKVKAFVLGADPSNKSNRGVQRNLEYVFGLNSSKRSYIWVIEENLKQIGLSLPDVYVQNLIQEYLPVETSKNKDWEKKAEEWYFRTSLELNDVDPDIKKPVLVTAERIMKLLYDEKSLPSAAEIYNNRFDIPYECHKLHGRPIIPFYRSLKYRLKNEKFGKYRQSVVKVIKYSS